MPLRNCLLTHPLNDLKRRILTCVICAVAELGVVNAQNIVKCFAPAPIYRRRPEAALIVQ